MPGGYHETTATVADLERVRLQLTGKLVRVHRRHIGIVEKILPYPEAFPGEEFPPTRQERGLLVFRLVDDAQWRWVRFADIEIWGE